MKKVIVLGAGITGLVTAWKLAKEGYEVIIIEKEETVGGLAGTIDWDGFKFDHGAHNFHTRHLELIDFYKNLMPDVFKERKNNVKLHIFGKLNKYPIVGAQVFFTLPFLTMILAGFSFFVARLKAFLFGIPETKHLDEWISRRFGKALYNIYFGPYLERVQKKSAHLLSSDIGLKKIPIFSIRQYIKREILGYSKFHPDDVNTYKTFYCVNGYGEFSNFFFNEMKKMKNVTILLDEPLQVIQIDDHRITSIRTNKNTYETSDCDIISTIPIERLIDSMETINPDLKNTAQKLEYTRMRFFLVKVNRPSVMGLSWVNFNDPKCSYYRVSEEVHGEFNMTPPNFTSLCFEIPLNKDEALWTMNDADLLENILLSFNTIFPLKKEEILEYKSIFVDHANPRMVLGYHESLEKIFSFIDGTTNLFSIGRQGLFTYVNLDGCSKMGLQFSDGYMQSRGKETNRDLLKKFHDIMI